MKKKVINKIKLLCNDEIKFIRVDKDSIVVLLPYNLSEIDIELEDSTVEEQIDSFIYGINHELENMINHLEDCKLNL